MLENCVLQRVGNMAGSKTAWGIEVGSYAVKAIRLERIGEEVRIDDFAYVKHAKPLSTPDLDVDEMIRLTLGQLVSQKNFEGQSVVMSVEGRSSFARFAKLPPVEAKKIPDIVKFEAVQQIPFPIEEVEWDSKTFLSEDSPETEVGIFAIRRDELERRLSLWGEHALAPEVVTVGPVALYNAVNYDFISGQGHPMVTLDIGTNASDLVVADGDQCWIRTFPIGGSDFTEAIATRFKMSYAKAERLKRESATNKYAKQIMAAMRPVFSDLLQDVQRSISHYESQHRGVRLERVLGVGSTFKIPGLRKFLGQQLQVQVGRLDEFKRIRVEGRMAADFASHAVNMATAYGLALQGVGLSEIDVNLNPVAAIREQVWDRKTKWFIAAAGVAVAASALMFVRPVLDQQAYASDEADASRSLDSTLQLAKSKKNALSQLASGSSSGFAATNLERLLDDREIWPHLVHDAVKSVASAGPEPVMLSSNLDQIKKIPVGNRRLAMLEDLSGNYVIDGSDRFIEVEMEIAFSNADTRKFLNDTVAVWLRQNAVREGVPYEIVTDSISTNQSDLRMVKVTTDGEQREARKTTGSSGRSEGRSRSGASGMGGGAGMGAPGGSGGGQPGKKKPSRKKVDPGAGPGGGGFGAAGDTFDPPAGGGFNGSSGGFGSDRGGGGRNSWESGKKGTKEAETETINIDLEAPIPLKPSIYNPGDTYHIGRVTFTVKLIAPSEGAGS